MRKTKKTQQQGQQMTVQPQPRLVKAGQVVAAREAQSEVPEVKAEVKKAPAIDPALLRTPRDAREARSMFEALFGDKAA